MQENFDDYLDTIKSENTKEAVRVIAKKLESYLSNINIDGIENMTDIDVKMFLKREYAGKSDTTVSNTISRMKKLFSYYNNSEAMKDLNLIEFKKITETREEKYLSPKQVYDLIESLLNYQDKALVLLIYIGLYDSEFNTIRHLKKSQFKGNKLVLENGEEIKLSHYSSEIIKNAIKEDEMEKYVFQEGRKSAPFKLNNDTDYILKSKARAGAAEVLPAITLKKRIDLFGRYAGIEKLTPIMIKNSKYIYDLVKLEYDSNFGMDINQLELKEYAQENNMVGQIEKLNMAKKSIKFKIIKEIVNGDTFFID